VSLRDRPTVSVVIASRARPEALAACLTAIVDQARRHGAEVIVTRGSGDIETLQEAYPDIRFIAADPEADAPALRALGLAAASGDIIALVDDDRPVPPDWLDPLAGSDGGPSGHHADADASPLAAGWAEYVSRHAPASPGEHPEPAP
jgi:glycosyltransferase involved in cell wall biosynthesis